MPSTELKMVSMVKNLIKKKKPINIIILTKQYNDQMQYKSTKQRNKNKTNKRTSSSAPYKNL